MPKKPKEIIITTAKPERKKVIPKTAFRKGQPNPTQFKPGESGRTRTKADARPDDERIVSRATRVFLGYRAPNERALAVGLPIGSSWAQVLSMTLIIRAAEGDVAALREVAERSEGGRAFNLGVGVQIGDVGEVGTESTPLVNVVFVSSDMRKLAEESGLSASLASSTEPPTLEAKLCKAPDGDAALTAARAEAQRAAERRAEEVDGAEEMEATADGEHESETATVTTHQPEPTLPQGYVGWPKWKILQYRGQGWRIPSNVVEV